MDFRTAAATSASVFPTHSIGLWMTTEAIFREGRYGNIQWGGIVFAALAIEMGMTGAPAL